jgi:BESS motif
MMSLMDMMKMMNDQLVLNFKLKIFGALIIEMLLKSLHNLMDRF